MNDSYKYEYVVASNLIILLLLVGQIFVHCM